MSTVYCSEKLHGRFVAIHTMHRNHIVNAIQKLKSGKGHWLYQTPQEKADMIIALQDELLKRNDQELHNTANRSSMNTGTQAVSHRVLQDLRETAVAICREVGVVTVDTLRTRAENSRYFNDVPGYAYAYVFKDRRFEKVGFLRSVRPSNHGRFICLWSLKKTVGK